jgi:hypothetical protein
MSLLELPARPLSPSALPAFTGPKTPAIPRSTKSAAKIVVTPAVLVTASPNPVGAASNVPAAAPAPAPAARKAPARKRTRKFVPDLLAKELPPRHVATLDAFTLNTALDTMFRLDDYAADLEIIARIRSEHPNELVVAERMTGWHLGSVQTFRDNATALFFASPASSRASLASRARGRVRAVTLALAPLIAGGSTIAATADGTLGLAATAVTALVAVASFPRAESFGVPELVDADWAHLRRDVVDASLAAVIKERNKPLSAEEETALTRGFEHLRHVGISVAALAGPAAPVRKTRAAR